jgi:hypothetical protein
MKAEGYGRISYPIILLSRETLIYKKNIEARKRCFWGSAVQLLLKFYLGN